MPYNFAVCDRMSGELWQLLFFYALFGALYMVFCVRLYRISKVVFVVVQLLVLLFISLEITLRIKVLPISLLAMHEAADAELSEIIHVSIRSDIDFIIDVFERTAEYSMDASQSKKVCASLLRFYLLYSSMYVTLNLDKLAASAAYLEFYKSLKSFFSLLSRVRIPVGHKSIDDLIKISIFEDVFEPVRAFVESKPSFDSFVLDAELSSEGNFLDLLSIVYNGCDGRKSIGVGFSGLFDESSTAKTFETLLAICEKIRSYSSVFSYMKTYSIKTEILKRVFTGNSAGKFVRGVNSSSIVILSFGRRKLVEVPKSTPEYSSFIDTMLIPDYRLLEATILKSTFISDYSVQNKSHLELISMLRGIDTYERLHRDNSALLSKSPTTIFYNGNNSSYEDIYSFNRTFLFHPMSGRNLLLHNYAQVGNSRGAVSVPSIVKDSCYVAENLVLDMIKNSEGADFPKIGFHGFSLGGFFSLKAAECVIKRFGQGVIDYIIFHNTFGDFRAVSVSAVGNWSYYPLGIFEADMKLGNIYSSLKVPKTMMIDILDETISPDFSLASEVSSLYASDIVAEISATFIELKKEHLKVLNGTEAGLKEKELLFLSLIEKLSTSLNSSGQPIGEIFSESTRGYYYGSERLTVERFFSRMYTHGSYPIKKIDTSGLEYFSRFLDVFDSPFLNNLVPRVRTYKYPNHVVFVPKRTAEMFYLLFDCNPGFRDPSVPSSNAIYRPMIYTDETEELYYVELPWRNTLHGKFININGDPNHTLSEDFRQLGMDFENIKAHQQFAWMHLQLVSQLLEFEIFLKLAATKATPRVALISRFSKELLSLFMGESEREPPTENPTKLKIATNLTGKELFDIIETTGTVISAHSRHSGPISEGGKNFIENATLRYARINHSKDL